MANHGRKFARALALAALCLLLGGCATNVSTDKLYALPSLPAEYASLEAEINALLSDGAEHAAPISGSNLQSVQMVDLDGDGVEEAVAFFRKATDERPVKIYFFRSNGDSYEQMALIEGTASSIYSITYYDLDGDGRREILVGFKSGTELQVLAVYTLRGSEPLNLLTTAYLRYAVSDLDGDGRQELTVLYSGEENRCMADCYTWDDRELSCISTLELSFSAPELSRVAAGALSDGQQALYVTGVADNSVAAYDILTVKNGVLRNVTQNTASSAVDGGFRFLSLYPTDIDGSGVIEIPEPIPFPPLDEESETYYRILWHDYDSAGKSEVVCRTFHNAADGWSLLLPETWDERVSLLRAGTPDENAVLFFSRSSDGQLQPFLEICALTGSAREEHARRGDRFVLARQVETVYTAELLPCDDWDGAVDEETVKKSFSLIVAEWTTGEN